MSYYGSHWSNRRYIDWDLSFSVIAVSLCIGFVLATFTLAWNKAAVSRECLSLGYRDYTVTWAGLGQSYCILRQDQTDIVVPIEEARQNPVRRP